MHALSVAYRLPKSDRYRSRVSGRAVLPRGAGVSRITIKHEAVSAPASTCEVVTYAMSLDEATATEEWYLMRLPSLLGWLLRHGLPSSSPLRVRPLRVTEPQLLYEGAMIPATLLGHEHMASVFATRIGVELDVAEPRSSLTA